MSSLHNDEEDDFEYEDPFEDEDESETTKSRAFEEMVPANGKTNRRGHNPPPPP